MREDAYGDEVEEEGNPYGEEDDYGDDEEDEDLDEKETERMMMLMEQ